MTIFNFCCLLIDLYGESYYTTPNSIFTNQDHIHDLISYQQEYWVTQKQLNTPFKPQPYMQKHNSSIQHPRKGKGEAMQTDTEQALKNRPRLNSGKSYKQKSAGRNTIYAS